MKLVPKFLSPPSAWSVTSETPKRMSEYYAAIHTGNVNWLFILIALLHFPVLVDVLHFCTLHILKYTRSHWPRTISKNRYTLLQRAITHLTQHSFKRNTLNNNNKVCEICGFLTMIFLCLFLVSNNYCIPRNVSFKRNLILYPQTKFQLTEFNNGFKTFDFFTYTHTHTYKHNENHI